MRSVVILLFCMAIASARVAAAKIVMPSVFGNHMVLQAGQPLPIWGRASPGAKITIKIASQEASAVADAAGRWRVTLEPIPRDDRSLDMWINGDGDVHFNDILIGEVWLCSGQSNMGLPLSGVNQSKDEIAAANHPNLRLFVVSNTARDVPQDDFEGHWTVCTPATARGFSAAAYFFGLDVQQAISSPVGLIQSSWGGTPCEAWTPWSGLVSKEEFRPILDRYAVAKQSYPAANAKYQDQLKAYHAKFDSIDPGRSPGVERWAKSNFDDAGWSQLDVQEFRERTKKVDGAFWFRKKVDIPAEWSGRALELRLGRIDDFDTAFYDGKQIGATGPDVADAGKRSRIYTVPAGLVRAGGVTIAVRIVDCYSGGTFGTIDGEGMSICPAEGQDAEPMNISDGWKTNDEFVTVQRPTYPEAPKAPLGPDNSQAPANLFNGMIAPLAPYAIRGAIWYQGENNVGRAQQYRTLLPTMVTAWREVWNQPSNKQFPFYIVQLAAFHKAATQPVEKSLWAELREAQNVAAAAIPNSGVAVAIDIGEASDIHPKNKQDIGKRLAALALHDTYGHAEVVPNGPTFRDLAIDGDRVTIHFNGAAGGLMTRDGRPLGGFALAGPDRVWHSGDAGLAGNSVVLRSAGVKAPVAVRYGWADNPSTANLLNGAGLPASPFRTDNWSDPTTSELTVK